MSSDAASSAVIRVSSADASSSAAENRSRSQRETGMAGETGGGGPGGAFPSGPHKFHILGGTRGDPIYNDYGPFLLLLDCFFQQLQ